MKGKLLFLLCCIALLLNSCHVTNRRELNYAYTFLQLIDQGKLAEADSMIYTTQQQSSMLAIQRAQFRLKQCGLPFKESAKITYEKAVGLDEIHINYDLVTPLTDNSMPDKNPRLVIIFLKDQFDGKIARFTVEEELAKSDVEDGQKGFVPQNSNIPHNKQ